MANRRARSMDRGGDRLVEVLERLAVRPIPPAHVPQFKAPQYNGQGDIEYFINRFEEITEANDWGHAAALLHLRESLKENAEDCGRAANIPAIYTALRARFGLSPREARSRLSVLRKEYRTSLQEHAAEVEKLVSVAYNELPAEHQAGLMLDTFCSTLGHMPLQRHLLAVQTHTLEDAVRAGNEFLQIRPSGERGANTSVRQIGEEEEEVVSNPTEKMLTTLVQAMQQLVEKVEQLQTRPTGTASRKESGDQNKERQCWGCGKTGHIRRKCPNHTASSSQGSTEPGNGQSPQ